ncbi:MAG: hypothetical protein ABSF09_14430 [Candidatus Bathyarchaeia archaeon]
MTDCPTCNKWMPCEAITEMQLGINLVIIRHYVCEECGQSWEKRGEELISGDPASDKDLS